MKFGVAPDPDTWAKSIGDCLQNIRASLDHLAFQLAESYSGRPLHQKMADQSEFPVFGTRPGSPDEFRRKVGGVDPAARSIIEGLQPSRLGSGFEGDPLWGLHRMANIDKHRTIHIGVLSQLGGAVGGANFSLNDPHWETRPLEDGAEIARYRAVPENPAEPLDLFFLFPLHVAFPDGPPGYGNPVIPLLRHFASHLDGNVFPPLTPFLD